jgi:hypothetical protein
VSYAPRSTGPWRLRLDDGDDDEDEDDAPAEPSLRARILEAVVVAASAAAATKIVEGVMTEVGAYLAWRRDHCAAKTETSEPPKEDAP